MFAFKNCRQLRCKVQGQTIYICLPCVLCCSFIDFDPLSGFTDLLDGCKIVVCHSSRIHNEPTRSPWIGRLRRTGAIFSFFHNSPPRFASLRQIMAFCIISRHAQAKTLSLALFTPFLCLFKRQNKL